MPHTLNHDFNEEKAQPYENTTIQPIKPHRKHIVCDVLNAGLLP